MAIQTLIFIYTASLLGLLALAVVYSELRRRRFDPRPSEDCIFKCSACGYVYTDDPDVDRSRCTQCGQMNDPIKF